MMNVARVTRSAGFLVAALLSLAWQTRADAPAPQSFLVELDYGPVSLQGRELDYAFVDPVGGLSGGGAIQRLDLDSRRTPRFRIAWRIPGKSGAWLDARFFTWEGDGNSSTGSQPGRIGALLASPDFAIGRSLVDRADATSEQRANSYSALLRWQLRDGIDGPSVSVAGGLRGVRFEERRLVTYRAERSESQLREFVSTTQDVQGWGPAMETTLGGRFGSRVNLGASFEAAFLLGRIDFDAVDQSFIDNSFDRATIATRSGERRDVLILGGSLWVDVRVSRAVTVGVAYRHERWTGVSDQVRFVDDVSQNSAIVGEGRATLTGPSLYARLMW